MATDHSDVAAELWALAETVLTRLEPVLRQAMEEQRERPRQGCSWCPVCALAALVRGEQHDLLTLLASESATVVALFRQLVAEHSGTKPGSPDPTPHDPSTADADESDPAHNYDASIAHDTEDPVVRRTGFVPITVTVKESATTDPVDGDS